MDVATTRLRKTFRYPTDGDNDLEPDALDEEEQEKIIDDLQARNARSNEQFKLYFLALPMLSIIPYVPLLFTTQKLFAILSITSLAGTTYLSYALPPGKSGIEFIDERDAAPAQRKQQMFIDLNTKGPILRYLPFLNIFLGGLVLLLGLIAGIKSADQHAQLLKYLPLGIYLFTVLQQIVMGGVDVAELKELKYDCKGA